MPINTGLIISFASWLGTKIADKGFDTIYNKLQSNQSIDDDFKVSIEHVCNKLENKYPDILGNSIDYFFKNEEVFDELCKLLFINQNVNEEIIAQNFDESTLPSGFIIEFITELKNELTQNPTFQEILVNKEIYITIQGISNTINNISSNSTLSIREIKEIKSILKERFKDQFNIDNFISVYYKNIIKTYKTINFIGLGIDPSIKKGKRKDLNEIFVKPTFQLIGKYHLEKESKLTKSSKNTFCTNNDNVHFEKLFNRNDNYVILGNAGAGKSLLTKSIILYIAEGKIEFENNEILSFVPFRIELKNYLAFKKKNQGSFLKYISYSLENDFQMSNILDKNISNILKKRNSILFFDGLDEIFDISDKLNVKNDIENFHTLFPNIRSITTSRFTGYSDAKLNDKEFCELSIIPFSEYQIKEYVTKWYKLEEDDCDIRNSEVADFIEKMDKIDKELLSNPLLLSLIVILYRNNLKIPESKLEIYQSCTNTLVDKWDAVKQLEIHLAPNILQKKEAIFSDLAFWQYKALSSDKPEITFHKAKSAVAESLTKKGLADEDNSDILAKSFLDYAQNRSIYFDNNFTHKTFLEYYTAYWIYSNIEKKHRIKERNSIIKEYISTSYWFIVLELLLNMIDKDQPDNEILDEIIKNHYTKVNAFPFLLYVIPNLKNISYTVQFQLYQNVIKYLTSQERKKGRKENMDLFQRIQRNLYYRNQKEMIEKVIYDFPEKDKSLDFYIVIEELQIIPWNKVKFTNISLIRKSEHYKKAIKLSPYLYQISMIANDDIPYNTHILDYTKEYITLFGLEEFAKKSRHSHFTDFGMGSMFQFFIQQQLNTKKEFHLFQDLNELEKLSLSKRKVLDLLENEKYIFISIDRRTNVPQLLLKEIEQYNKLEQAIIFYILRNIIKTPFNRSLKINNLKTSAENKIILHKIISCESHKEILNILFSYLEITDSES